MDSYSLDMKKPKPYNNNTMTSSAFRGMIRSCLRQKSRRWKPIITTKQEAKRRYNWNNKKQKREYQCNKCKEWRMDKETQVDHIIDCWQLNNWDDLKWFVERLFCEKDWFQVLCNVCHNKKTAQAKINKDGKVK